MPTFRPSSVSTLALFSLGIVFASPAPATAEVTGFGVSVVPQTTVTGFVAHDITIDFENQLTGVQLLVELTAGSIFQQPGLEGGGDTAPSPAFFGVFAALEFDTFVSLGGADRVASDATPGFAGGAVNLGGQSRRTFDDQRIDVAYFPPGGVQIIGQTEYFVARLTLSDDATGTVSLLASDGEVSEPFVCPVYDGMICIPEPTAAGVGLLAVAALGLRGRSGA